jgi:hypothetical protein
VHEQLLSAQRAKRFERTFSPLRHFTSDTKLNVGVVKFEFPTELTETVTHEWNAESVDSSVLMFVPIDICINTVTL